MPTSSSLKRESIRNPSRAVAPAFLIAVLAASGAVGGQEDPHAAAAPGVELRLTVGGAEFKAGERVLCKLEIVNTGAGTATFDPQNFFPFRVLRVLRKDGTPDWFIGSTPQTMGEDQELPPGASRTLWENVDAADLFLLEGGSYTIHAEHSERRRQGGLLKSNSVPVTIKGGSLPYRKTVLKRLRSAAPEGWRVQTSGSSIAILHSPTGLKKDISSIQIWFTDVPLPDDYELGEGANRQEVNTIGKTKLGFTHFALSARAADLWPQCRAAIPLVFVDETGEKQSRDDR